MPFRPGLILDALIGYSLEGVPRGPVLDLIESMREAHGPVISLDVPSGLDSTTGASPCESVEAAITVTLALPKIGLVAPTAGELWLADLGIPKDVYARAGIHLPPIPLRRSLPHSPAQTNVGTTTEAR